jgi:alpha-L-fucosidase
MFIHWGLYSIQDGTGNGKQVTGLNERVMNDASIPVNEYKTLAPRYSPTGFNAHDIVALVKSTAIKYLVITAKKLRRLRHV